MKICLLLVLMFGFNIQAAEKKEFTLAWSHYTGWEPVAFMAESGILKKWADKYGIKINVKLINDYIESINLYTNSSKFDACTMTNMDALSIPANSGVDSTALIVGDFSNGNDGIVSKSATSIKELATQKIRLVEFSVSHYLLSRALEMSGVSEKQIRTVNTSDADIGSIFANEENSTVVTWNPILLNIRNEPNANLLFDSSKIPGEIIDMIVVKTSSPESFKRALTGAWYETMAVMGSRGKTANKALSVMAKSAGSTVAEFKAQLRTTAMFYRAKHSVSFTSSKKLKDTMEHVRTFLFTHDQLKGASSKNDVGIEFPDKTVFGKKSNIKLRFNSFYTQLAADGKL